MFKKIVIALDENNKDSLVEIKKIEKIKSKIKVKVNPSNKAIIYRDLAVSDVLQMGEYLPFTKQDKKHNLFVVFVNMEKSQDFNFLTRQSQIKDKINDVIYSLQFSGTYSFSVRNERKFMGTCNTEFKNISKLDFASKLENDINSLVLSYILNYFEVNKIQIKNCLKHKEKIEKHILVLLNKHLDDSYGVEVREIKLDNINITEAF